MSAGLRFDTVTRPVSQLERPHDPEAENPCRTFIREHRGQDPWHPVEHAHSSFRAKREAAYAQARAICQVCPVREACLTAALDAEGRARPSDREGMWGALDPFERAAVARRTGAKSHKSRRMPINHGRGASGAEAHRKRGEKPCQVCIKAERLYRQELAARRRAS